jgi:MFS family permease
MEPVRSISIRPRWTVWFAVLATSPLAYLGSIWFESRLPNRMESKFRRDDAIQAATRFAAARHIDTTGWRASLGLTQSHKELAVVLRTAPSPLLESVATPLPVQVLLQSPDGSRWLRAQVTPRGRVVGFQQNDPPGDTRAVDEATARVIAEAAVRERLGPDSPFLLEYKNVRVSDKQRQRRTFTWQTRLPGQPEVKLEFFAQVLFDRVVNEGAEVTFDEGYVNRLRPYRPWISGLTIAALIYVAILGVYAIIRYIRRATEKEVSHRRTLLIALTFVGLACVTLIGDPGSLSAAQPGEPYKTLQIVFMFLIMALSMSVAGGFMGIAYGAGEGALREAFPGKVTSLDALLAGKIFSANVARSILFGGGVAGWALAAQNAALWLTGGAREVTEQTLVKSSVASFPLLSLVMDFGTDALLMMTFGVLLPFAFMRPRMRRPWLFYCLLPVFSVLCAVLVASGQTAQNFAVTLLALVAVTYAPFFYVDLLAATAGIFALRFAGTLSGLAALSPAWFHITMWVGGAGTLFLAAELYFAARGKVYLEWEVRPKYARYLAEHLAMQAEIGAARQAQVRLLPDAPPKIAGLSIAGSCVPSREVGGDFFDFYELADHRLGVFLAEGGGRQLGSAMTIALAKGYLLHATQREQSPAETLRRLRDLLACTFHGDGFAVSMLYGVIDARAGSLRYARAGVSPRVVINGNEPSEEVAAGQPDEMTIRIGAAALAPNDALVFFSDGFEAQIARRKRQPANRYLAKIARDIRSGTAADLHAAMIEAAFRKKNEPPPDDVTAVVVRLDREAERAMEVVA